MTGKDRIALRVHSALLGAIGLLLLPLGFSPAAQNCGNTWQSVISPTASDLNGVCNGGGLFVAVGANGTFLTSPDGSTWTNQTVSTTQEFYAVAYGNGRYVAVGSNAAIYHSQNGTTWQPATTSITCTGTCGLIDVIYAPYGGGFFTAVGYSAGGGSPLIATSADGNTWSVVSSVPTGFSAYSVAYGSNAFVACGTSGAILRSPNGTTWNQHSSGVTTTLYGVANGGGWFVGTGEGGTVIRSQDGMSWTAQSSGTTSPLIRCRFLDSRFFAVGSLGIIIASPYGEFWTNITSGSTAGLYDIAGSSNALVAVGRTGTILRSVCGTSSLAVTSVQPGQGPTAGNTQVYVTGTGFQTGAGVSFGGSSATSVYVQAATTIACFSPSHAAGAVDVTVTNPGGASATLPNGFTYSDGPGTLTVTACVPDHGPASGGTPVILTGSGFQSGATVTFGGDPASAVVVSSATSISCVTPAGLPGQAAVTVTNPGGASATMSAPFIYTDSPSAVTVTGCTPNSGSETGGTSVTLMGTGFQDPTDVLFGGYLAANVQVVSPTTITCQTPPHPSGAVEIQVAVIGVGVAFLPNGFTYGGGPPGPTLNSVTRLGNPFRLRLDGSNFHPGCVIRINGNPVPTTSFKSNSRVLAKGGSALKAMVPAGVPVEITVLNTDDGGVSAPFMYIR